MNEKLHNLLISLGYQHTKKNKRDVYEKFYQCKFKVATMSSRFYFYEGLFESHYMSLDARSNLKTLEGALEESLFYKKIDCDYKKVMEMMKYEKLPHSKKE